MEIGYEELYKKMSRLQWLLHKHHMQSRTERGPMADPTRGQGRVLALLKLQPEISTKDLAYLLGIRQQSLNELLNKLEKHEYVMRTPSEADRRVMMVKLTEKGKAQQQEQASLPDIFDCLSKEEQETFGDYLDRLIAALEVQLGTAEEVDEMYDWMDSARNRMGEEMFEQLMSMRGGPHPHGRGDERFFHGFGGPGCRRPEHGDPRNWESRHRGPQHGGPAHGGMGHGGPDRDAGKSPDHPED